MKKGMMIFAAIALVSVLLSPVYAVDTTVTGLSTTAVDAGPDIAVSRTGKTYVSARVSATQFQVVSDGAGTFSNVIAATVPVNGEPNMTAVACYGPSDSVIVAVASDTNIAIYVNDTGTASLRFYGSFSATSAGAAHSQLETASIEAFDLIANDSFILLVAAISTDTNAPQGYGDSTIYAWSGGVYTNGASMDLQETRSLVTGVRVSELKLVSSVSRKLDRTTDTSFVVYMAANLTSDTTGISYVGPARDSGIFLARMACTSVGAFTGIQAIDSMRVRGIAVSRDTFYDMDLNVDQVSSSDTEDLVTVVIVPTSSALANCTLAIVELKGDSQMIPGTGKSARPTAWVISDTFLQVDTGLANSGTMNSSPVQSLVFGRNGASIVAIAQSANGALHQLTTSLTRSAQGGGGVASAASVSWSVDTYGVNTGYGDNNFSGLAHTIHADTIPNRYVELQKTLVNGTLYVVGHNKTTGAIWYTTYGWGESKKKDSGVCLMDRMFGHTSLRAAFPALKSFRDTLLGTDMGRKLVSLYYSF